MTIIVATVVAFVASNIDDIFLLAMYFTQINSTFRKRHIVLGQYLGFAGILAVSLLGFIGALVIPKQVIGLLGFAPIYMGLRRLGQRREAPTVKTSDSISQSTPQAPPLFAVFLSRQTYSVAVVTFANGGDNISIYIPLFAGKTFLELGIILMIFASLIALWCYLGYRLGRYPILARIIEQYGHVIVPFVLVGLGIYILIESSSIEAILGLLQQAF